MSSSTRSMSQMRANVTLPTLAPSVTAITVWACSSSAVTVWASTSWWVVTPPRALMPLTPTKTTSRLKPRSDASASGPDELVRLGAGDAAGDEQLEVASQGELGGDVEGVGDDRQARPVGQGAGDLGGRRAAGQPDDGDVAGDALDGDRGDAPLDGAVRAGAVAQREVEQQAGRRGAPVRAGEQVPLLEQLEVAPHRGLGHPETRREVGDRHRAGLGQLAQDQAETLLLTHGA